MIWAGKLLDWDMRGQVKLWIGWFLKEKLDAAMWSEKYELQDFLIWFLSSESVAVLIPHPFGLPDQPTGWATKSFLQQSYTTLAITRWNHCLRNNSLVLDQSLTFMLLLSNDQLLGHLLWLSGTAAHKTGEYTLASDNTHKD